MLHGKDLPIYGSGKNIREWIHVSDHARALAFLAKNGEPGEIYNIGSGDEFDNLAIAQLILDLSVSGNSRLNMVPDRKGHDFRYSLNSSKIINLGWAPLVFFKSGLQLTFDSIRASAQS